MLNTRHFAALALLVSLSGCYWRIAREPMPFVTYGELGPERARGAIVLLPGFADQPKDFDVNGFVPVLHKNAPEYDIVAPDAHVGYYNNATLVEQLHANVIGPLIARGYRELWISGVSMGGHGAVAYARSYPERVRGLLLFAPYLGPGDVVQEVAQAGGICRYTAPMPLPASRYGFAQANFVWLKDVLCSNPAKVSVWVGVGDRDLAPRELLREVVEPDHFVVLPGGHDWNVWTPALERIARSAFGDRAALGALRTPAL
jgi:pimeloyl-ACP methyl ester carboxylesterase